MYTELYERILELSKKHKLSHLGSCLTAVGVLDDIYKTKRSDDIVILSSGHAGLALYVVLEKYEGKDAESLLLKHGVHPSRDTANGIYLSTGSLGMGITVAVGCAIASPGKKVYCVLSDGECAEGSVWESLAAIDKLGLDNIEIIVNANGFSAYDSVDISKLETKLKAFSNKVELVNNSSLPSWLPLNNDLEDHYKVID